MWFPITYKTYGKPNVPVWSTAIIQFITTVLFVPLFGIYDLLDADCLVANKWFFSETQGDLYAIGTIFVWMMGAPFLSILFSDILIVYKLKTMKGTVRRREREISISLLIATLCFLILNIGVSSCLLTTAIFETDSYRQLVVNEMLNVLGVSKFIGHSDVNFNVLRSIMMNQIFLKKYSCVSKLTQRCWGCFPTFHCC